MNEITLRLLHSVLTDFGDIDRMIEHPAGIAGQLVASFEGGVVLQWVEWPLPNHKRRTNSAPSLPSTTSTSEAIFMSQHDSQ